VNKLAEQKQGGEVPSGDSRSRRKFLRVTEVAAGTLGLVALLFAMTQFTLDVQVAWNGGSAACGSAWDLAQHGVTDDGGGEVGAPSELSASQAADCVTAAKRAVRRGGLSVVAGTALLAVWLPLCIRRRRRDRR
jgi:hypothetical protein